MHRQISYFINLSHTVSDSFIFHGRSHIIQTHEGTFIFHTFRISYMSECSAQDKSHYLAVIQTTLQKGRCGVAVECIYQYDTKLFNHPPGFGVIKQECVFEWP